MKSKNPKSTKSPLKKEPKHAKKPVENSSKKSTFLTVFGVLGILGGGALIAASFLMPEKVGFQVIKVYNKKGAW